MEEDVFPNRNAKETEEGLEEERRLFYVAITRAQRRLRITAARKRRAMGQEMMTMPSRFLKELPDDVLENPIRWGTFMYQSNLGANSRSHSYQHSSGGVSVATELQRLRNMFDRARAQMESEPEMPVHGQGTETLGRPALSSAQHSDAWDIGTRVLSPRFGSGVITAATGYGDTLTYTINFECGEKRIVAKYGMLEKEPDD
jgi:DNA helicase-2/ATP-dependent DNA helicase PcrA